jgi:O-antigen/teichoic acid export membrane protein
VTLSYLSGDNNVHDRTVKIMLVVNGITSLAIFLIILLFSGIISGWYGDSFEGLAPVLNLMILSCLFGSMGSVYIQELISRSKNWTAFFVTFIKSCLIILIGVLLIKALRQTGAYAFAMSSVIANILYLSSLFFIYRKATR